MRPISRLVPVCLILLACIAVGQERHILSQTSTEVPLQLDSDAQSNPTGSPLTLATDLINLPGASALRVKFSTLVLGPSDYVEITSIYDGLSFRMTAEEARKWQNTSPWFNGANVELKLVVYPGSTGHYAVDGLIDQDGGIGMDSICFTVDDRTPSTDYRSMRFSAGINGSAGCTIWLASSSDCVLTAGHCLSSGSLNVAEVMVPLSSSTGAVRHPDPNLHQFTVDFTGAPAFRNAGVGQDFGMARLNPNAAGQSASSLYGWYDLDFNVPTPGTPIRITGYGTNSPRDQNNQTLRTHLGPELGSSGTAVRYQTDTTGGNSGSPVIDEATGRAIGIHTHAGCGSSGGSNQGTSLSHPQFMADWLAFCPALNFQADTNAGTFTASVGPLPQGASKVLVLASFATAGPVGSGPIFGLTPDAATLQFLSVPAAPGNLFHSDAPFIPGFWPDAPFSFPLSALSALSGMTADLVAVVADVQLQVLGNSAVRRVTF